jgi:hypothetical protein
MVVGLGTGAAQQAPAAGPDASQETTAQLLEQLKAQDARLKELEAQVAKLKAGQSATPAVPPPAAEAAPAATTSPPTATPGAEAATPAPAPEIFRFMSRGPQYVPRRRFVPYGAWSRWMCGVRLGVPD